MAQVLYPYHSEGYPRNPCLNCRWWQPSLRSVVAQKTVLNASLWSRNSAVYTATESTPEYRTSHFLCKHGTVYNIICIMTSTDLYKGYLLPPDSTAERWHHRSPHSNDVVSTTAGGMAITKHLYLLEKRDLTTECLNRIVIYRGILQLT